MSCWQISEAASKRIQGAVADIIRDGRGENLGSIEILDLAMKMEDFARPRCARAELLERWISEGVMSSFVSSCFYRLMVDLNDLQEAAWRFNAAMDAFRHSAEGGEA